MPRPPCLALAGAFTVASSPYVPAEGALYPQVARTPQELSAANVAHGMMDSAGFLVGSTLTGVLLAATTPQVVFGLAAIVAALTALLLAGVRRDERPKYDEGRELYGVIRQTALGFRACSGIPGCGWSEPRLSCSHSSRARPTSWWSCLRLTCSISAREASGT